MPTIASAQYVANAMPPPDQVIRAVDIDGTVYWLDDTCQQGDWLAYIAGGGSIDPADPGAATDQNIIEAPDTLFGGPTIAQVLGES
jgi:hypothetical protein